MEGKILAGGEKREDMGFGLQGFFLIIAGRTKRFVRRFKGNHKNGRMLNPKRLNGQSNVLGSLIFSCFLATLWKCCRKSRTMT